LIDLLLLSIFMLIGGYNSTEPHNFK